MISVAVEDREMHALVDLLAQLVEIRPRLVGNVHAPAHQRAEPEQRDAEPVLAAVAVLLEHAFRHQRHGQPVHGALGDSEPPRQRADADLDLVLGERLEQPDRGGDRRQPLAPAGCASVLPTALRFAIENGGAPARVPQCGPLFRSRPAGAAVS